jgi:hypothetical protein
MPVHKVKGGYKWGSHGHVYPNRKDAEKQAQAIYASGYKGKSIEEFLKDLESIHKRLGGATMASKIPEPKRLQIKRSLDSIIAKLEMTEPPNDNYEIGNGGEVQIKPENAIDAAEHKFGRPGERMRDPSEGKVNKELQPLGEGKPYPKHGDSGDMILDNVDKADMKNIVGTGAGAGIGAAVGGPVGAGVGGVVGNELTKPKPPSAPLQNSLDTMLVKCRAELRLKKAITMIEGYTPMTYIDLVKAFGSTENIPDIMKEELRRPPTSWFETAIMKASSITKEPFNYAVSIWYGKDFIAKINPLASAGIAAGIEKPEKIGTAGEGIGKVGQGIGTGITGIAEGVNPAAKAVRQGYEREILGKGPNEVKAEEGGIDDNVEKIIGGALVGGGIGALTGHPLAGAAIGAGGEMAADKLLGKSINEMDPTRLGQYIIRALQDAGFAHKAVAEPIGSKYSPDQRKPKFDDGGESEISGDGTKLKVKDLADKSKTTKTF